MNASERPNNHLVVLHSCLVWLPQTMTWLYSQVKYLPEEIENHVLCDATENLDQFPHRNIHSMSAEGRTRYFLRLVLRKIFAYRHVGFQASVVRKTKPDILHSHFGNRGWMDRDSARKAGIRHVVTFYGADVNFLPRADARWVGRYHEMFRGVDRVLCEGPHMAKCIVGLGCPEEKVLVHHLGVVVDEIPFRPRVYRKGDIMRVFIASSFLEKKGIPYGIAALGRLQEDLPLEITIIGDATAAARALSEKKKILDAIERFGLSEKTRLLGYQPYSVLYEEAYRHHIFLSPSVTSSDGDTEGGAPVTIIEMLATGMPVVSTTHCDIPNVVHHGVSGLLSEERDADGLYRSMRWLADNPGQWDAMCRAGRQRVEAEFNVVTQAKRLAAIYFALKKGDSGRGHLREAG